MVSLRRAVGAAGFLVGRRCGHPLTRVADDGDPRRMTGAQRAGRAVLTLAVFCSVGNDEW